MKFSEVVGHKETKKKLIQSIQDGRIPHAQLFLGQEGSGNLALALAYIQYVNCLNRTPEDSCGTCISCQKTVNLAHPDVHYAFPVVGSDEKSVSDTYMNDFRDAVKANPYLTLQDWIIKISDEKTKNAIINTNQSTEIIRKLLSRPFEAQVKFMIIWMPERMNPSSGNKLLKTLEEPPANTAIIMVANNDERMLKTILSRLQIVKLRKINDFDMLDILMEHFQISLEKGRDIVNIADGNYNTAKKLAELQDYDNGYFVTFMEWMRSCFKLDMRDLVEKAEQMSTLNRDGQKAFYIYSLHMIRESMAYQTEPSTLRVTESEKDFLQNFARFINVHNAPEIAEKLEKTIYHIERNAHPKITFMNLSLQISQCLKGNFQ